jgi:hypothetical protein
MGADVGGESAEAGPPQDREVRRVAAEAVARQPGAPPLDDDEGTEPAPDTDPEIDAP